MRPLPDQQSLDAVIAETWTALNQANLTRQQADDLATRARIAYIEAQIIAAAELERVKA